MGQLKYATILVSKLDGWTHLSMKMGQTPTQGFVMMMVANLESAPWEVECWRHLVLCSPPQDVFGRSVKESP